MAEERAAAPEAQREGAEPEHELELERLHDRWLRARADLENYRKRADREVERRVDEARTRLVLECLEVADSVDLAVELGDGGTDDAMVQVQQQMRAVLARQGVERIEAEDAQFDPELHEAVGVQRTDEGPPNAVVGVVRTGYRAGDRVLRPARVIVSRRPAAEETG